MKLDLMYWIQLIVLFLVHVEVNHLEGDATKFRDLFISSAVFSVSFFKSGDDKLSGNQYIFYQ